uniref:scavenger receptor cysteine-rich type 1 protein M160-like n=1 Tax=Scatophagus argus TaxID=75038 RepID=UPI001ED83F77|nr:scavenger receptor cysteine-rich type 1 protein M160-like [Scatophagus argus]
MGGFSRCAGTLEIKDQGDWKPVDVLLNWSLQETAVVCQQLDCGFAVSNRKKSSSDRVVSIIHTDCFRSRSNLRECATTVFSSSVLEITCSDSVRLVNGTSLCSGRLEVKAHQSNQSDQWWSSVCEADFDQQDAEVVCRELGCGAPSVLQGGLYGGAEAATWSSEFQCGGHESALLDCRSSGAARNTCSPGKAVGLTCSEPVRLVGGPNPCSGSLEVKHLGHWKPVTGLGWTLKPAGVICRQLDCGSAVAMGEKEDLSNRTSWHMDRMCVQPGSDLRECLSTRSSYSDILEITCSDSVRLVNGTSPCSGRLEVKAHQSNQSDQWWSSVCEADFDQQDAEVVCRELGCGAPSVLQGGLYGGAAAATWSSDFQCGGHESALLDCRSSGAARNTCSPGKAVGLTCSEPVRLVGGPSPCSGSLEVKHLGHWKPVDWTPEAAAAACRELDCGSAVSTGKKQGTPTNVWSVHIPCVEAGFSIKECVHSSYSSSHLEITCSGGTDPHDLEVQ